MNFFDDLIDLKLTKNMGLYNMTDEFFCLYLNQINRHYENNILVVVNSLFEANQLFNSLLNYNSKLQSLLPF